MNVIQIQKEALTLPEDQRAKLAADLLESLPVVLADYDDGSDEAIRRINEMKAAPSTGRTWEQIKSSLGR